MNTRKTILLIAVALLVLGGVLVFVALTAGTPKMMEPPPAMAPNPN